MRDGAKDFGRASFFRRDKFFGGGTFPDMRPLLEQIVRPLGDNEMHLPIRWAEAEGWNPGRSDWAVFRVADPGCMLTVEAEGRPVGVISAARIAPGLGFIGFFVVSPEYRGNGYGLRLWKAALQRLAGRVIGLDGVTEQQVNYARSGFVFAHRTLCYGGVAPALPPARKEGVRAAAEVPFEVLAAYDTACFGSERTNFLRAWLTLPESRALVFMRDGQARGVGVVRRCRTGVRIGPLFADDDEAALALFDALAGFAPGEPLSIDVPEPNTAAVELARRRGMEPVLEAARMYRGPAPTRPLGRIYGVTSCALG